MSLRPRLRPCRSSASQGRRLAEYEQQPEAAQKARDVHDPFALATLEFGIAYEHAVLDWFDRLT